MASRLAKRSLSWRICFRRKDYSGHRPVELLFPTMGDMAPIYTGHTLKDAMALIFGCWIRNQASLSG